MKSSTQKRISERRSAPRGSVKGLAAHALLLMSLLVPWAASAATLTDVQFNALQGGSFEARFTFEGPAPEVKGYTIEKPARIALDLVGATNQLGQKKYPLAYDNASSAVVLEGRDRTRVVLNLVRLASYETRIEGNQLVVSVGAGGSR
ncbi:MAG: AMIN domain-containing protein, partial [Spongiibacter sp.]|nr:AMIN domain-containing protein [Spongiibacter sp.]